MGFRAKLELMKKVFFFLLILLIPLFLPKNASADYLTCSSGNTSLGIVGNNVIITLTNDNLIPSNNYSLRYTDLSFDETWVSNQNPVGNILTFTIPFSDLSDDVEFWNYGGNSGINFVIKDNTANADCLVLLTLKKADADAIAVVLHAAGVGVPAPPAPPAGGGGGAVTPPCHTEFDPAGSDTGVNTGLGCIPTQPQDLVKWILKYAILMGGGIAFLLSVFGGVSIILAGGNPEKINSGKEIIGSALTGLLFIIFSVFLLRFIGLDILQLPGFK